MKRLISFFCAMLLLVSLSVPAFAESEPRLTGWFYYENPKDEAYADRLYNMGRELTLEEYDPNVYAGGKEPTPEEKAAAEASYAEYMKKYTEIDRERNLEYYDQRNAMMNMVFGDDRDLDRVANINFDADKDGFEGDYAEYKNKDGSVTRVYDNGSVMTKYADGSYEGFDAWNNRHTADKDGNQTVYLTDGSRMVGTADGRNEWHGQDGSVITTREDGTLTWRNSAGIVIDYNAEGERAAIGFEHGEKLELLDGMFPTHEGELKGPNGASISWYNGSTEIGDDRYSFRVVGENGTGGRASWEDDYDRRVDVEATREKKLETNGKYKGLIMTSDTRAEITNFKGEAWEILRNNTKDDVGRILYENEDGDVFQADYLGNGFYHMRSQSADGKEKYESSLDEYGFNATYWDEKGEHAIERTIVDDDGNVVTVYDDGGKMTFSGDENGTLYIHYTHPDGTTARSTTDEDGNNTLEYTYPELGISYTSVNGEIVSGNVPIGDGFRVDIKDGETTVVSPTGEKVQITQYSDGSMSATLADGTELTKEPGGDWYRDGKQMHVPHPTEKPEPTEGPEETDEPEETPEPTPEPTPTPSPGPGEPGVTMETWLEFLDSTWQSVDFSFTSSGRMNKSITASPNCNLSSVVSGWIGGGIGCAIDPGTGNLAFSVTVEIEMKDESGGTYTEYYPETGIIAFVDENHVRMSTHRYEGDATELFQRVG